MQHISVRDLTTPLEHYTTISQEASLKEAFVALEGAFRGKQQADPTRPRDFSVLVVDEDHQVIGRLMVWDVLRGLETQQVKRVDALSMVDGYGGWSQPLSNLATKAQYLQVKNLVSRLHRHESISVDALLDQAVHALVTHRFLSLIATECGRTVGGLRVVDVFNHVCAMVWATSQEASHLHHN
jgi:hypothetical protein